VVSTQLKNTSQNGNRPQVGVKIKNIWNHHLDMVGWKMDRTWRWGLSEACRKFLLSECRPEGNKLAGTCNWTLRKHRPNEPRLFPLPNNEIHGDSYSKSPLSRCADGSLGVAPNRSLLYMLLLMEEILLTSWGNGSFSPLFTRFCTSQMLAGFLNHQQYGLCWH